MEYPGMVDKIWLMTMLLNGFTMFHQQIMLSGHRNRLLEDLALEWLAKLLDIGLKPMSPCPAWFVSYSLSFVLWWASKTQMRSSNITRWPWDHEFQLDNHLGVASRDRVMVQSNWNISNLNCPRGVSLVLSHYPLVNIQKTMENHHFSWENPRTKWWFSIVFCMFTRGYFSLWSFFTLWRFSHESTRSHFDPYHSPKTNVGVLFIHNPFKTTFSQSIHWFFIGIGLFFFSYTCHRCKKNMQDRKWG